MKILSLILLSGCLLIQSGCSTNQTRIAYKAEVASTVTVQAGIAAYRAAVKQGMLTMEQRNLAQKAFDRWKAAQILAIDATENSRGEMTTDAAFNLAQLALTDFINLLTSFGIKIN